MISRCRRHREKEIRLVQVAPDPVLKLLVQRPVGYKKTTGLPVPGAWEPLTRPDLSEGVYCAYCLAEGCLEAMDVDDLEYVSLGRIAHYYPAAESLNLDDVWPKIQQRFEKQIVSVYDTKPRAGIYGTVTARLPEVLRAKLSRLLGPKGLYRHQALAINAALEGKDIVVATPTASGKSACYVIPVLSKLLENPNATALYIAPTQALAEDQFGQWLAFSERRVDWDARARLSPEWHFLREVHLGSGPSIYIARYDGGTDAEAPGGPTRGDVRRRVRHAQPRIVITTPEMLHTGILGHPGQWGWLLRGLSYVILDEMHCYKGLFGGSMAQVLRRLQRRCDQMAVRPQFIGCSATIRNPDELGLALMGRVPEVIGPNKDGSPRRRRRFVIMDSGRVEEHVLATARNLVVDLVRRRRLRTIVFTRSIGEADTLYNRTKESLQERNMAHLLRQFKAVLPSREKRSLASALKAGRIASVISTNALELGLDIGELSAAVLVKFPGSMSSLLQQAGRVGRRGEGLIFMLADENPLNQFFVQHPDEFFAMSPEEVYLDPDHAHVVADHLVCGASEIPLDTQHDQQYWGTELPRIVEHLVQQGRLRAGDDTGRFVPADPEFFPTQVGLRNQVFFQIPIVHLGEELAHETGERAPRSLHRHARIQLQDAIYEVASLRLSWSNRSGRAEVRLVTDRDFITTPYVRNTVEVLETYEERRGHKLELAYGAAQLCSMVLGYYKIPIGLRAREEERSFQALGANAPPSYTLNTRAIWFTLPGGVGESLPVEVLGPMLRSLQKSLVLAACIHLRCDPGDLDGVEVPESRQVYLYDSQAGGSGLAAKVYEHFPAIWTTARRLLADCPFCNEHPESRGCPKCVTDEFSQEEGIDRHGALSLFDEIDSD